MISALLAGIVGIGILVSLAHWDELLSWLKDFVVSLAKVFMAVLSAAGQAAAVFMQVSAEGLGEVIHRLFYIDDVTGQAMERTTTRTVPMSEVPDWAKAKLMGHKEVNMTRDFEAELQMKIG